MLPMFKPSEKERKVTIAEVNRDIKATFEEAFSKNYQMASEELINNGFSQEDAAEILTKIKSELEQEMILKARELLNKSILNVLKNERQKKIASDNVSDSMPDNASLEQPNATLK
jgi:hypothetical protein